MKHNRLLWFLILLICISLSCTLYRPGHIVGVTSVSVTPHSGSGKFQASVTGEAHLGSSLRCYIPEDNENGKRLDVEKYNQPLKYDGSVDPFDFNLSFPFSYTVPGTHTLICMLGTDSESAWNQDFVVVGGGDQPPATQPPVAQPLTVNGTATVLVYWNPTTGWPPCSVKATKVLLTVNPDNSAQLVVAYPVPNGDCTPGPSGDTGDLDTFLGTADPAAGTLKNMHLPSGDTIRANALAYTTHGLSGTITIFDWNNGNELAKISMP